MNTALRQCHYFAALKIVAIDTSQGNMIWSFWIVTNYTYRVHIPTQYSVCTVALSRMIY